MPKNSTLPKTVYITRGDGDDGNMLDSCTEIGYFADGVVVGVYQLVKVARVRKTPVLEDIKPHHVVK